MVKTIGKPSLIKIPKCDEQARIIMNDGNQRKNSMAMKASSLYSFENFLSSTVAVMLALYLACKYLFSPSSNGRKLKPRMSEVDKAEPENRTNAVLSSKEGAVDTSNTSMIHKQLNECTTPENPTTNIIEQSSSTNVNRLASNNRPLIFHQNCSILAPTVCSQKEHSFLDVGQQRTERALPVEQHEKHIVDTDLCKQDQAETTTLAEHCSKLWLLAENGESPQPLLPSITQHWDFHMADIINRRRQVTLVTKDNNDDDKSCYNCGEGQQQQTNLHNVSTVDDCLPQILDSANFEESIDVRRKYSIFEEHSSTDFTIVESLIPTYLDTISEENSDDLVSYGRTSSRISPLSLELGEKQVRNSKYFSNNEDDSSSLNLPSISSSLGENLFDSTITITDKDNKDNEKEIIEINAGENFIPSTSEPDLKFLAADYVKSTESEKTGFRQLFENNGILTVKDYNDETFDALLSFAKTVELLTEQDLGKKAKENSTIGQRGEFLDDRFSKTDHRILENLENLSKTSFEDEEEEEDKDLALEESLASEETASSYLEKYDDLLRSYGLEEDSQKFVCGGRNAAVKKKMTEYDLRKANRRFERYRSVYKDAPKSGVDEFNESKSGAVGLLGSDTSFSSTKGAGSSTSLVDDIYEMLKQRKASMPGKILSSSEKSLEITIKRDKNGQVIEQSSKESEETGHYLPYKRSISGGVAEHCATTDIDADTVSHKRKQENFTVVEKKNSGGSAKNLEEESIRDKSGQKYATSTSIHTKAVGACSTVAGPAKKLAQKVNAKKLLLAEIRQQQPLENLTDRSKNIARLSDVYSDWSFSSGDSDMEEIAAMNNRNNGHHHRWRNNSRQTLNDQQTMPKSPGGGRLVIATATSKAVIKDPAGREMTSLIAAASANAVSDNPYVALAQATADAASKVSQVVDMTVADPSKRGKVSLVVSSTIRAAGRDLSRCSRENLTYTSTPALDQLGSPAVANEPMSLNVAQVTSDDESGSPGYDSPIVDKKHNVAGDKASIDSTKFSSSLYENSKRNENRRVNGISVTDNVPSTIGPQHVGSERLLKLVQKNSDKRTVEPSTKSCTRDEEQQPVLTQRNLDFWSNLPENSADTQQQLLRWKNSVNLTDEEFRKIMEKENMMPDNGRIADSKMHSLAREIRDQYMKSIEEMNEELKNSRRNRYKAKIDKAKKEYLESKASVSDLYKNPEDFQKKFNVSIEHIRLPEAPRGPYLEFLGKNGSLHSLKASDIRPVYHDPGDSLYDTEYEKIVRRAERLWEPYKKRSMFALGGQEGDVNGTVDHHALYDKGMSTGCLQAMETTFDNKREDRFLQETDLDQVFAQTDNEQDRDSRSRIKNLAQVKRKAKGQPTDFEPQNQESRTRARSVDYLADQKARQEIEPPENQLKKVLGDEPPPKISDHELQRFMKSTEKLQAPDWYDQQQQQRYSALGFPPSPRESVAPSPAPTFDEIMSSAFQGIGDRKSTSRAPSSVASRPSEHTRYANPWTYGPRPEISSSGVTGDEGRNARLDLKKYDTSSSTPADTKMAQWNPDMRPSRNTAANRVETTTTTTISQVVEETSTSTVTKHQRRKDDDSAPVAASVRSRGGKFDDQVLAALSYKTPRFSSSTLPRQASPVINKQSPKTNDVRQNIRDADETEKSSSSPVKLPRNFFDKYKDEIEEMRKSRANLNFVDEDDKYFPPSSQAQILRRVPSYGQNHIPVATVRPSSFSQSPSNTVNGDQSIYTKLQHGERAKYPTPTQNGDKKTVQINEEKFDAIRYDRHDDSFDSTSNKMNSSYDSAESGDYNRRTDGWTVSNVPASWNVPGMRRSVVIEVGDAFLDDEDTGKRKRSMVGSGVGTLEEVLDKLLNLPTYGQKKISELNESTSSLNNIGQVYEKQTKMTDGKSMTAAKNYGIYCKDSSLMKECRKHPDRAEALLEDENLYVRCSNCDKTRHIWDARQRYVSCHYCYTYYCSRACRKQEWTVHKEKRCNFARISSLCKGVIQKTRLDPEAQREMSNVAMQGYSNRGKGSVNFRFNSPFLARKYIEGGWLALSRFPAPYLNFYTVDEMVDAKKDPNLIKLCRLYDPERKFVLSVSIIAEIEDVPETPVSERKNFAAQVETSKVDSGDFIDDDGQEIYGGQGNRRFERSRSVPNNKRKEMKHAANLQKNKEEDTKTVLKSILRSMENIAPGPVYISAAQRNAPYGPVSPQPFAVPAPPVPFERNTKQRSTALGIEKSSSRATNGHNNHSSGRQNGVNGRVAHPQKWRPCALYGESDLDETEV